jgi:hypothetical protein
MGVLALSSGICSVKLYRYALTDDRVHLLPETPSVNPSEFMRHLTITYTSHYNRRHRRAGNLFHGRYRSILVDSDECDLTLSRYIHPAPVRTKEFRTRPV